MAQSYQWGWPRSEEDDAQEAQWQAREAQAEIDRLRNSPIEKRRIFKEQVRELRDSIVVAFDIEGHCENDCRELFGTDNNLTEVGLAFIDLRDVKGVDPGDRASNWFNRIDHRHWRSSENLHHGEICRKKWHRSDPHKFLFGRSEWVPLRETKGKLEGLIEELSHKDVTGDEVRNLILITFASQREEKEMAKLDINLFNRVNLQHVDLQKLYLGTFNSLLGHPPRMEVFASSVGFQPENLHNGGNDAALELRCALAVANFTDQQEGFLGDDINDSRDNCLQVIQAGWPSVPVFQNELLPLSVTGSAEGRQRYRVFLRFLPVDHPHYALCAPLIPHCSNRNQRGHNGNEPRCCSFCKKTGHHISMCPDPNCKASKYRFANGDEGWIL